MPASKRLAIRLALVNAIAAIQAGSVAYAGEAYVYQNTVKPTSIYRDPFPIATLPNSEMPSVLLGEFQSDPRAWGRGGMEGSRSSSFFVDNLRLMIYGVCAGTSGGNGQKDDAAESFLADLEVALVRVDPTFGGLVMDLRFEPPLPNQTGFDNTDLIAVQQPVRLRYERLHGVP